MVYIKGHGQLIIDNELREVSAGDVINISRQQLHCVKADENIQIVEIQSGSKNIESDIVRIEKDWKKILNIIENKKR